jgi:hypothetical protein
MLDRPLGTTCVRVVDLGFEKRDHGGFVVSWVFFSFEDKDGQPLGTDRVEGVNLSFPEENLFYRLLEKVNRRLGCVLCEQAGYGIQQPDRTPWLHNH